MQHAYLIVRTLLALGSAALFAACSGSGPSETITPSGVAPDSQTRLAQTVIDSRGVRRPFAYVTNFGYSSSEGNVSAYTINKTSGVLTPVAGSPFAAGTSPIAVAVDPKGNFAYVTNYGYSSSEGNVSAYTINATSGVLTPVAGSPFAAGTSPIGVAVDPKGKFVYVSNIGSNNVSAYTINATSGVLTPVAGSPFAAGTSPRGVAVDLKGQFAYVTNQGSGNVSAYTINKTSGVLTPVAGSPFAAGSYPWAVAVDPKGKFAYVSNDGSDNVSAYTINATSGVLTPVAGSPFGAGMAPALMATYY